MPPEGKGVQKGRKKEELGKGPKLRKIRGKCRCRANNGGSKIGLAKTSTNDLTGGGYGRPQAKMAIGIC